MHFTLSQQEQAQQVLSSERVFADFQEAHRNPDPLMGVTMGWEGLDALTSGAQDGEVVTWVARPNVGKSFTMARVAIQAQQQGKSVLFVTMEMSMLGMVRRMLGVATGINPDFIKRGEVSMFGRRLCGTRFMAWPVSLTSQCSRATSTVGRIVLMPLCRSTILTWF
ncbi:DnaB-like helicase C-terminal domain-containing protein [uncultured Cohaesibacter sp.]|uniref:DnaB-like helicase C-terminal domain-containing protein n=1 Tax=uncultured Cohaesibacter sp. TaxID=1002546 RepID=UPI002AA912EE|nr:DnaB-like helicase C-terminal domain-containing protein [uncultured Cohaesibacter sp.]